MSSPHQNSGSGKNKKVVLTALAFVAAIAILGTGLGILNTKEDHAIIVEQPKWSSPINDEAVVKAVEDQAESKIESAEILTPMPEDMGDEPTIESKSSLPSEEAEETETTAKIDDEIHAEDQTESKPVPVPPPAPEKQTDEALEKLATPRILGDPNSALKISEHSSFTCGHCKHFHETNFKKIKADYIDTGKAYIVFDDFPRNQVDIIAGAIARCIPEKLYFNFVQLLFETQEEWAYKGQHINYLMQNAQLTGLSAKDFQECLNNRELQKRLAASAEKAHTTHDVSSTPTLIINDKTLVPGLLDYNEMKKIFDQALSEQAVKTSE